MLLSINRETLRIGRFTSTTVKPTRSQFFTLTPEVYGSQTVVLQQLTSRCLERGTRTTRQRSVCEVSRPTDMLGRSCIHQKLDKLALSQSRVLNPSHEFEEPSRLRVILHQGGDRPCRLRGSS